MTASDWIRHGAVWAAFLGQTVFVAGYVTTRWWQYWITRSLMFKSAALWMLLTLTCWRYAKHYVNSRPWDKPAIPDSTGDFVESSLYVLVAAAIVFQAVALVRERWKNHRADREPPHRH